MTKRPAAPTARPRAAVQAKTQPTGVPVQRFLATVPEAVGRDCATVAQLMEAATGAAAEMWGSNIVGFGRRTMTYASGRQADWMIIAFAPRKGNITLYLNTAFEGCRELLEQLGPHTIGKSCLHIRRLSDVKVPVLKKLLTSAVRQTRAADQPR
jgi:hypothetical protein